MDYFQIGRCHKVNGRNEGRFRKRSLCYYVSRFGQNERFVISDVSENDASYRNDAVFIGDFCIRPERIIAILPYRCTPGKRNVFPAIREGVIPYRRYTRTELHVFQIHTTAESVFAYISNVVGNHQRLQFRRSGKYAFFDRNDFKLSDRIGYDQIRSCLFIRDDLYGIPFIERIGKAVGKVTVQGQTLIGFRMDPEIVRNRCIRAVIDHFRKIRTERIGV